jgi:hypothetical protein
VPFGVSGFEWHIRLANRRVNIGIRRPVFDLVYQFAQNAKPNRKGLLG